MCGIWGFIGDDQTISVQNAWAGLCSLTDRGPDDWGVYVDGHGKLTTEAALPDEESRAVLGNRRLSIIDLSAAGNQPMVAGDRYWIVYNGEVYNYRELRAELREAGYTFESGTDTEVVLRAYEEYGSDCVERFRGMFAFAVWDTKEDRLFAARDRFGIKPLYYDADEQSIAFASEVTALLDSGVTERRLDKTGVDGFLAFGSVPSPRTIVEDVRSLPPGATLVYERGGQAQVDRYWTPTFDKDADTPTDRIRELVEESVALRLRSDVPVGAFLSGGLDSSTIVAAMQASRESAEALHTFSIGFEQDAYSETTHAERVAEEFGTEHTTRVVTAADIRDQLPEIIAEMDQPTIDGVNTFFVSQLAADEGLRVALSGLGSDELFYGYPSFQQVSRLHAITQATSVLPDPVSSGLGNLLYRANTVVPTLPLSQIAEVIRSDAQFGASYLAVRGLFTTAQRRQLQDDEPTAWASVVQESVSRTLSDASVDEGVSHAELGWYMHNQLLRDTDTMSMAHSLEVRVPFLDSVLAESVMHTKTGRKHSGKKELLSDAFKDVLPTSTLDRDKTGFTFPFAEWLSEELAPVVDGALDEKTLERTPLDLDQSRLIRERFEHGELHWSRLWALVVLSLWVDEHIATGGGETTPTS